MRVEEVVQPLVSRLESLSAGVVCASADRRTVYANRRIESMVGRVPPGVPGAEWARWFGLARPDGAPYRHPGEIPLLHALEDGEGRLRMSSRNGKAGTVVLDAFTTPVCDSAGNCLGSVGIFWPVASTPPRGPAPDVRAVAPTVGAAPPEAERVALLLAAVELSRRLPADDGCSLAERALALVSSRYAEDWTLATLGAALHATPRHLTTVVSMGTGVGLMQRLATIRVDHARQLLRETDDTVDSIARAVGLEDRQRFSRTFRRVTGLSPTAYRERSRRIAPSS